jgi:hypothetical protein
MFRSTKSIARDLRQNTGIFVEHVPTSQLFGAILKGAPKDRVTLAWLFGSLRQRSFGIVMLLLGMLAMVPGISILAALLLAAFGFQMMMAYEAPVLPRFIARRTLPTHRIAGFIAQASPVIKFLEKFIRPRWHTPFRVTKRVVGFALLLLAATLFMPIPLSNIIPGAVTMLVAFAYLEEDGVLLCIALIASLVSVAITGAEMWGSLLGASFLLRGRAS